MKEKGSTFRYYDQNPVNKNNHEIKKSSPTIELNLNIENADNDKIIDANIYANICSALDNKKSNVSNFGKNVELESDVASEEVGNIEEPFAHELVQGRINEAAPIFTGLDAISQQNTNESILNSNGYSQTNLTSKSTVNSEHRRITLNELRRRSFPPCDNISSAHFSFLSKLQFMGNDGLQNDIKSEGSSPFRNSYGGHYGAQRQTQYKNAHSDPRRRVVPRPQQQERQQNIRSPRPVPIEDGFESYEAEEALIHRSQSMLSTTGMDDYSAHWEMILTENRNYPRASFSAATLPRMNSGHLLPNPRNYHSKSGPIREVWRIDRDRRHPVHRILINVPQFNPNNIDYSPDILHIGQNSRLVKIAGGYAHVVQRCAYPYLYIHGIRGLRIFARSMILISIFLARQDLEAFFTPYYITNNLLSCDAHYLQLSMSPIDGFYVEYLFPEFQEDLFNLLMENLTPDNPILLWCHDDKTTRYIQRLMETILKFRTECGYNVWFQVKVHPNGPVFFHIFISKTLELKRIFHYHNSTPKHRKRHYQHH